MWRRMQGKKQNPGQASYEVSHLPEGLGMVHKKTVSIKCLQDVLSLRTLLRSQQALRFWQIMYFWYMSFPSPLYMNIFKGKHPKRLNLHYSKFVVWHFSHTFIRFFSPAPLVFARACLRHWWQFSLSCSPLTMFRRFSWDQKFCSSSVWFYCEGIVVTISDTVQERLL